MNTPFASSLGPRLSACLSTLALLAAIGLFASRPARTAGGPVPVTVSNTVPVSATAPLPTTAADNPAKQPFQARVSINLQPGQTSSTNQVIPVPSGKRLVIQTIAMYRLPTSGALAPDQGVRVYIGPLTNNTRAFYPLPFVPTDGTFSPGTTQAVTLFADPGSGIQVIAYRNGPSGNEIDFVNVAGYLLDVP